MSKLRNPTADRWDLDLGFEEWGLSPPFPRRISFADVDSETEINGHFLVIEGKREHERLAGGQLYTNRRRVLDGRTVLVIYGDPPYDVRYMQHFQRDPKRGIAPATLRDVQAFCWAWAVWAEVQEAPAARVSVFRYRMVINA